MSMKILYHGTDIDCAKDICKISGININAGIDNADFGKGFYTTDDFSQAEKWAKRKARARLKKPAVVTLYFDQDEAAPLIHYFTDDLRWGRFVINNRNGADYIQNIPFKENNLCAQYPITYGRIADIDVINIADNLKKEMQMLQNIDGILNENYPMQIAFHTESAIKYIKKMSYRVL